MDCIHTLKYLNIFLTTFFTFLLALFAFFQWRTVEKQTKLNLLKLRMEHYSKIKAMLVDFAMSREIMDDLKVINSNKKAMLKDLVSSLSSLIQESGFLFNEEVFDNEKTILDEIYNSVLVIEKNKTSDYTTIDEQWEIICKADEILNSNWNKFLKV